MYNVAFTGIVIMSIVNLVDLDQVSIIILQSVGVLWASFFCSFAFVLPRLLDVSREHRRRSGRFSNSNFSTGMDHSIATGDHSQASTNLGDSTHGKKPPKVQTSGEQSLDFSKLVTDVPAKLPVQTVPDPIRRKSEFGTSSSRVGRMGQSSYPFSTWESMVSTGDKLNSIAEMLRSLGKHSDDSTENNNNSTSPEHAPSKNNNGSMTNMTVETIPESPPSADSSKLTTSDSTDGGSGSSRGFHTELLGKDFDEIAEGSSHSVRMDI
jgi:hypothetical protein